MTPLRHIVEPVGLLLTWQPQDEHAPSRTRRVVGEIRRNSDGVAVFSYLKNTPDFEKATAAGFRGYPAFSLDGEAVSTGVLESFLRRLPPRKRDDFSNFLALHRLPAPFEHSDIALLAYTGARLPSDGFALVPIFDPSALPCDFLLEVAGFRYAADADISSIQANDKITFAQEDNPIDSDAIAILHAGVRIGYVNRAMRSVFHNWLAKNKVEAVVERKNGKPERPLIYLRVSVS